MVHVALAAVLLLAALLPLSTLNAAPVAAQTTQDLSMPRYFSETGFWVQGRFREYWETHGGLFVHGYPISAVFEQDGMLRQYFERSVFEYHPDNAGTEYEVLLTRLGAVRTEGRMEEGPFQPIPAFESSQDHVYHPETRHARSYGFKDFWNRWGGLPNFGHPLSEEFDERNQPPPAGDGEVHTVQYYERARFEYHPEIEDPDYQVLLGLLGQEYLQLRIQDGSVPDWALARQDPHMPPYDEYAQRQYGPHAGMGFNIFFRGDADGAEFHQRTLDLVKDSGFGWIKIKIMWSELDRGPGLYDFLPVDRIVNAANDNGIKVVASVVGAPERLAPNNSIPTDTEPFEDLMREMSSRYAGKIQAWEIWNEHNLAQNTGGHVSVGPYVDLLKAGYEGVKAGDSRALVLFGGLTPTGVNDPSLAIDDVEYLRQIYAYNGGEVKQYYDALAAHPGSNNNPPDTLWPDNPGPGEWTNHPSFYFRRIEQLRQVMVDHGEAHKQIWLTEFGWTTANQAPGYEYGNDNSEQEQAEYLVRAFQIARERYPWMGVMQVWHLNYALIVPANDEKHPWGVIRDDWSTRPAYDALKAMPKP